MAPVDTLSASLPDTFVDVVSTIWMEIAMLCVAALAYVLFTGRVPGLSPSAKKLSEDDSATEGSMLLESCRVGWMQVTTARFQIVAACKKL